MHIASSAAENWSFALPVRTLPPLDAEFALVAACALLDDASLQRVAPALLDRPGFDWTRATELAFYHEVEQVMVDRVEQCQPAAIPSAAKAELQQDLVATAALQAAQVQVSVRLVRVLADAGIPSLLVKGVGLSQMLYAPRREQRVSGDIDILVAPEDLAAADLAFREAGLSRSWPEQDPPAAALPMLLRMANVYDYREPAFNGLVELHCRLTLNPFWMPVTFAQLREASIEVPLGPGNVQALDGPLNTFYLCQHAIYSEIDFRLKWFADIARAVRRAGAANCASHVGEYPRPLAEGPALLADDVLRGLGEGIERAAAGSRAPVEANADAARIVRRMVQCEGIPAGRTLARLPIELAFHSLVLRHQPGWRGKARQLLLALSDPRDAITLGLSPRFELVYWLAGPVLSLSRFVARRGRQAGHA